MSATYFIAFTDFAKNARDRRPGIPTVYYLGCGYITLHILLSTFPDF